MHFTISVRLTLIIHSSHHAVWSVSVCLDPLYTSDRGHCVTRSCVGDAQAWGVEEEGGHCVPPMALIFLLNLNFIYLILIVSGSWCCQWKKFPRNQDQEIVFLFLGFQAKWLHLAS